MFNGGFSYSSEKSNLENERLILPQTVVFKCRICGQEQSVDAVMYDGFCVCEPCRRALHNLIKAEQESKQ